MDEFLGISGNKSGLPPVCFGQRAHASAGGSRVRLAGQNCAFVRSRWISRSIHERSSRTVVASAFLVLQDGGVPVLRKAFLQSAALVIRLQPCDSSRGSVLPQARPSQYCIVALPAAGRWQGLPDRILQFLPDGKPFPRTSVYRRAGLPTAAQ